MKKKKKKKKNKSPSITSRFHKLINTNTIVFVQVGAADLAYPQCTPLRVHYFPMNMI